MTNMRYVWTGVYLWIMCTLRALIAPKVLSDYLRPMMTIHPTQPNPQSLFNHLNRPWIVPSQPSMTTNDYRWLSDDNPMTIGRLSDDYPMIIRWQSNDYHKLLIYFLDDHLSKKIYRPKMIVKSGAIFILKWSCYVVWDTHSNLVQALSICCNSWNILIKDNFLQQYVWN